MANFNKKIFEFIKTSIAERFKRYEKDEKPYSFSISLSFHNNTPADIKLVSLETGVNLFIAKFDEAVKQGVNLNAEKLIFREFDDAGLSSPVEHRDMYQELLFGLSEGNAPVRKKEKASSPTLGLGDISALVEKQMEPIKASFREKELKLDHERDLEKKDRTIQDLQKELENTKKEKDEEIEILTEEVQELTVALEEASKNKWSQIPLGTILGDAATHFLRKNPNVLSGFGVPDLSGVLGPPDNAIPERSQSSEPDERSIYYDRLIEFYQTLDATSFGKFLQIVVAIEAKSVSIDDLHSLLPTVKTQ